MHCKADYMEDCIHLHACRKVVSVAKSKGFTFARGCNEDCEAYQNALSFLKEYENDRKENEVQPWMFG